MGPRRADSAEFLRLTEARVAEVATTMGEQLTDLTRGVHAELAESIPELRGDPLMLDLLRASIESNIETFLHVAQYSIVIEDVRPPSAAVEYARRLAQRGTSSNALLRAYRLGQQLMLTWVFEEIAREELDGRVAFAAAEILQATSFSYIDKVSEQVVAEYEAERERWLANRNTVRATMLATILTGTEVDVATAERALGYRLWQHHVGVVAWASERDESTSELRHLESLVAAIGEKLGAVGQPLFIPQDRSLGWAWVPLGRTATEVDASVIDGLVTTAGPRIRVALGSPGAATAGFRTTHIEAIRAHTVATIAGDQASAATSYGESGVRTAALLAGDLEATRDLVRSTLGGLGADDPAAERLRDTLLVFLTEKGSYLSTSARLHVHKNTVKYRVDKAVEARGSGLDHDRFNLELALTACRWLGRGVLPG
ncbi:PucR family transcriptional regulator [Nocardioides limicola]|uniref:PucR family transcriptional regulator n=1 Tax=Nocardioides limicola TaxID=2803368 RepID=UPI001EF14E9A|nr:helix-turn-helix domain-containing protein [Nocardioides sp. DJM-14]